MKTIGCLNDLREFGIVPLTGEADALSYRILCDVTKKGKRIIEEAFGGVQLSAENWNPGSAADRHVASVMLSREAVSQIAPIALIEAGCHTVLGLDNGTVLGFEAGETFFPADSDYNADTGEITEIEPAKMQLGEGRHVRRWPTCYGKPQRFYRRMAGSVGNRCQHAMSGRVA